MSIDILKLDSDVEQQGDSLPPEGGTYGPLATGLYPMIIKLAYLSESAGGATALNLVLKQADGSGPEVRETFWVTSGKAKGKKNYYIGRDGKKIPLPGMTQANQLHQLVSGKELHQADVEKKVVKLWSFNTRQEEPTEVNVVMSLVNQPIVAGIIKAVENKRVQDANGNWGPGPEKRELNEIDKFFSPDGHTLVEKNAGGDAKFIEQWKKRFPEDYVANRYKPVAGSATKDDTADDLPWSGKDSQSDDESSSLFS